MTLTAVRQLPGVKEVTGDLSAATLVIAFDPTQVSPDQITKVVEKLGYSVEGTFQP